MCGKLLANRPSVRAELIDLNPDKGDDKVDPDLYLRRHGLAGFRRLPRQSYLFWLWRQQMESSDGVTVAGEATRKILEQPDPLLRYDLLVNLHMLTGIPMEFLWEGVVRLAGQSDTAVAREIAAAAEWMRGLRQDRGLARQTEAGAETWHLSEGVRLVSMHLHKNPAPIISPLRPPAGTRRNR